MAANRSKAMVACLRASAEHRELARQIQESVDEPGQCLLYVEQAHQKLTTLKMNLELLMEKL
jgi:hypothetical protein